MASRPAPPFLPQDIRIVARLKRPTDIGHRFLLCGKATTNGVQISIATLQARDGMNAPWQDIPIVFEPEEQAK